MRSERREMALDDVSAGMTLADDVRDAGGSVLLPGGTLLTEAHLASLRRRGVERLALAVPVRLDDAAREAELQRLELRLAHLFRGCAGNAAAADLRQRLLDYRRSRL